MSEPCKYAFVANSDVYWLEGYSDIGFNCYEIDVNDILKSIYDSAHSKHHTCYLALNLKNKNFVFWFGHLTLVKGRNESIKYHVLLTSHVAENELTAYLADTITVLKGRSVEELDERVKHLAKLWSESADNAEIEYHLKSLYGRLVDFGAAYQETFYSLSEIWSCRPSKRPVADPCDEQ